MHGYFHACLCLCCYILNATLNENRAHAHHTQCYGYGSLRLKGFYLRKYLRHLFKMQSYNEDIYILECTRCSCPYLILNGLITDTLHLNILISYQFTGFLITYTYLFFTTRLDALHDVHAALTQYDVCKHTNKDLAVCCSSILISKII